LPTSLAPVVLHIAGEDDEASDPERLVNPGFHEVGLRRSCAMIACGAGIRR
jgi:hypothetical protein